MRKQQQRKAVREVIRYRGKAIGGRIFEKGRRTWKGWTLTMFGTDRHQCH